MRDALEAGGLDFRPASAEDLALLKRALLVNANVVQPRVTPAMVATDPAYTGYWQDFPRSGEFGFVAEQQGIPVGVVWTRQARGEEPLFGFVADDVPEITICVLEGLRGAGVGYDLLVEIEKEALRRNVPALSLWVEEGNRSRRLYGRRGFVPAEGARPGTMIKRL